MKYCSEVLDLVVDRIIENMSFDFDNFNDAALTISVNVEPEISIRFDRLSMRIYSHNLPKEDYSYVISHLRSRYQNERSRDEQKTRAEYNVLLDYFLLRPEYASYVISKETRPDFVVTGARKVGIEVTEFTTEIDSVMAAISNQNFGQGKTAKEIYENARLRHGAKADRYSYKMIAGSATIGTCTFNVRSKQQIYADEIIKKYHKYCGDFEKYDEFIVLCDARYTINVTSFWDSKEVIEMAKEKCSSLRGFTVCILRQNSLCKNEIDTFNL